jgi:integrase
VTFEVTQQTRRSIACWFEAKGLAGDEWLFPSRSKKGFHITTRQYARLVDKWVASVGLDPALYGTHSMRRTKVSLLYKKTGNLRACQLLLGHTKLESTVRYLGVEVDDALELSESLEL